ncbi:MAG: NAD-dependent deacylase [Paracoccaceae bacterium]|nr:NAD-dependent deacylase [Paracoccaceae bacterium]MDE2913326.1 NAD-dependent deacylase [Paracoccaceae bacterium]
MRIVILTGAGISAESGLGTFRDKGGLWSQYDLAEVATPEGFARNPHQVHDFYNARRENAARAKPNAAHVALARLNGTDGPEAAIVTQNIDDLHERAGSRGVIHMHGEVARSLCGACGSRWDAAPETHPDDPCPECGNCPTRPDVVWFGEYPYRLDEIERLLRNADLFAAIGTSGEVYPAAGFVETAHANGSRTVEINLEPSQGASRFQDVIVGRATETVPVWVDGLISGES